jgi:2-succinyl-6-hydroxy-2,4-cyclohexadiene-1-carboxylate synthase
MKRLIFIHGFGGLADDWSLLVAQLSPKDFEPQFLSLPGHAMQPSCKQLGMENPQELATFWGRKLKQHFGDDFYLVGYSMGARIATLLANESGCKGLALFSGGMGIETEEARDERRDLDDEWGEQFFAAPEKFWRAWYKQEIFLPFAKKDNGKLLKSCLEKKIRHRAAHLVDALRTLSPAEHGPLLPGLKQAVNAGKIGSLLYVVGKEDKKYLEIAAQIKAEIPAATVVEVPESGHVLHLEAPTECAKILKEWLGG